MKEDFQAAEDRPERTETGPRMSRRTVGGSLAVMAAGLTGSGVGWAETGDGGARQYMPELGADYATTDPVYFDPEFPSIHFPHVFMSQGQPIQSFMWLADNNDAKGCVIFSPQLNGGDSLDSLIPPLLSAGINVMRFNPRGMWDGNQDYSIIAHLEDLHSAVAFLRQNGGLHSVPPGAGPSRPYRIDPDRIAVLGKSGGGGMIGWIAAAENSSLNTVIAVEPAMLMQPLPAEYIKMFTDLKELSAGRLDFNKWLSELGPADYERMNMIAAAPKLADKNVLLIASLQQDYLDGIHRPLVQAMQKAEAKHFKAVTLEAGNEYFLTKRIALARLVISWLKTECAF